VSGYYYGDKEVAFLAKLTGLNTVDILINFRDYKLTKRSISNQNQIKQIFVYSMEQSTTTVTDGLQNTTQWTMLHRHLSEIKCDI